MLPAYPPGTESRIWAVNKYSQGIGDACIRLQSGYRVEPGVVGSSVEAEDCGGRVEVGGAWEGLITGSSMNIAVHQ